MPGHFFESIVDRAILAVGGSYFVGRVFVELLERRGIKVFVLNRGTRPFNRPAIHEIPCDRRDTSRLAEALAPLCFDAVVDFCAYSKDDVNPLLEALGPERAGHYIQISSCSVYAPTKELPVIEDARKLSGPQPELGPAADYGFNKWLAEYAASAWGMRHGVPVTILRPTIVFGPYNYAPRESWFFETVLGGRPLVLPAKDLPLFSFIFVEDVAEAVFACINSKTRPSRAYNLAGPELVSYGRYAQVLEKVLGRKIDIQYLPVFWHNELFLSLEPQPLSSFLFSFPSQDTNL
ncbi:MAG: NAD-dependent epimerase/dehydratase family protein, partial [Desulfatibacillaceae bacterium]|nr:NAD-dependent epimerase/dehydratase family protein [Desulfatibacillaceae bacterium]